MKLFTIILLFSITTLSFGQNVKVTDYKVPISRATNLRANGFWNWGQVGDSVSSNTASASLLFRRFYSSLPFAWFLNVDAIGGRDIGRENYDIRFDGSIRKYVWERNDWFGFSRVTAQKTNQFNQVASDLTVGAGYGRYINATALAKAVRIEEHLIREKVITGHLPKENIINIANIIEREDEYRNLYGEAYETRWFDDIENEVQKSGLLIGSNIGSIGFLRIRQVLFNINERVNQRYYGWDISAGTLFTITTRDKSPAGSPNFTVNGRYSFPINWRIQVNLSAGIFTPIDTSFGKRIDANSEIDFIYELSNRVNFLASYRLGLFKDPANIVKANNLFSASFLFYIENNIYFGVNGGFEKVGERPKRLSTSVTLQYNLF